MSPIFSLKSLALILPLLPTILAVTPTTAEMEFGKIAGFTHGGIYSSHAGDYFTSTFCFCAGPDRGINHRSDASYLQFEYYSWHRNTTFVANKLCLTELNDGFACHSDVQEPICNKWWDGEVDAMEDEMCYRPAVGEPARWWQWELPGRDEFTFNDQRRRMDKMGGQGPVLKGLEEAEDRCETLCDQHAGLQVVRGDRELQCHVVVYEDLDDMCDLCA